MRFSIFENDGTLGATGGPLGQVLITATGIVRDVTADTLKRRVEAALAAGRWQFLSVHGTYNSTYSLATVRVTAQMFQTLDPATIRSWFLTDMAAAGFSFSGVSVVVTDRYTQSPDLVAGASTVTIRKPKVVQAQTVNSGNVATVNVPISFDDDPKAPAGGNAGLSVTTMVLIGLAAVLVLKRL